MASKRVNPRRRPASYADVGKAFNRGIEATLDIVCWVLKEKMHFSDEQLAEFNRQFNRHLDSINRREISQKDLRDAMSDEYDLTVETT